MHASFRTLPAAEVGQLEHLNLNGMLSGKPRPTSHQPALGVVGVAAGAVAIRALFLLSHMNRVHLPREMSNNLLTLAVDGMLTPTTISIGLKGGLNRQITLG